MPGRNKRTAIAFLILVCLLALIAVINRMAGMVKDTPAGQNDAGGPPAPTLATVDAHWHDIVAVSPAAPRGSTSAAFSLVEFGDFQCPQCGKVRPQLEDAVAGSGGRLNLYFFQRPFPSIHPYAQAASEAAVFAAKRGKFWPMYDFLYAHQTDLEPGNYDTYAEQLGMSGDAMRKAIEGHNYSKEVDVSSALGDKIGIRETPTVAMRDNHTGKFIWLVEGGTEIGDALAKQDWMSKTQTASSVSPKRGG